MSTSPESRDGIEQVREILVGAIHRDLERKLARLEARVASRLGELQQEARRRTDVIEAHHRTEIDKLSGRLESELTDLKEKLRGLTREHREKASAVEQHVAKLEESFLGGQHEVRAQMLDQAKTFLDELHQAREELTDAMNRELEALDLESIEPLELGEEPRSRAPREDAESQPH